MSISPDSYPCNIYIPPSCNHSPPPQSASTIQGNNSRLKMPPTVMDIILNTPLKLLSTEPSKTQFLSQSSTERLETAYTLLAPYYSEHLETAWPRTFRTKSGEKSSKYRNAGNSMFSRSKLRDSIRLYNEAIFWAESESEELGMAFANR